MSAAPPNDSIKEIADVLGEGATRDLVRLFLSDFPVSILKLARGSREEQVMIAHGLKSSSLHMGAAKLSKRMAALEAQLGQPGEPIAAAELTGALAEFEAIAPSLRQYAGA